MGRISFPHAGIFEVGSVKAFQRRQNVEGEKVVKSKAAPRA